jgi:signal transduction histidine kinase
MPAPLTPHEPLLVNTIGHFTGTLVFGVFVLLLLRTHTRANRQSLAAGSLALVWNVSSLTVLGLPEAGRAYEVLVALGTSALSLLPAVLLEVSMRARFKAISRGGYAVSAAAVAIHACEQWLPPGDWHRRALLLTTVGFAVLTGVAAMLLLRQGGKKMMPRLAAAMSLFLFSLSLVHAGAAIPHSAWSVEMLVHHAGVPLALIVLLQDYRFLLLDTFARVLASFVLAGALLYLLGTAARMAGYSPHLPGTPFQQGLLLMGVCLLLLIYAVLRSQLQRLLTRVLFGPSDLEKAKARIAALGTTSADEAAFIGQASQMLADFLGAEIQPGQPPDGLQPLFPALIAEKAGVQLIVPLRYSPGEVRYLLLGARRGGRRYLSEDLQAAERLASQIMEQVEQLRNAEMRRLVVQAELRALESQIHPHFLFNALNTLYGVIPRAAGEARRTVLNLADILRYVLPKEKTYIALEEELRIVEAYLEIETLRLGARLRHEIDVPAELRSVPIPVLSLQPLVENAVKHAVAAREEGGLVRIEARACEAGVRISVQDTGPGFAVAADSGAAGGLGVALANVKRRLELCYGEAGALLIRSSEGGSRVEFTVRANVAVGV